MPAFAELSFRWTNGGRREGGRRDELTFSFRRLLLLLCFSSLLFSPFSLSRDKKPSLFISHLPFLSLFPHIGGGGESEGCVKTNNSWPPRKKGEKEKEEDEEAACDVGVSPFVRHGGGEKRNGVGRRGTEGDRFLLFHISFFPPFFRETFRCCLTVPRGAGKWGERRDLL